MSRTDKDKPWRIRERPHMMKGWKIHLFLMGGPPRWYRHTGWYGPDRAKVRDEIRDALKEHRAHGDVDKVLRTEQHRYRSSWNWF